MHCFRLSTEISGGTTMKTLRGKWIVLVAGFMIMSPLLVSARGQGIIIDHRPGVPIAHSYEIREVSIDARVRDQVAEVQVAQTFHNPGSLQLETEFLFPLPEDGAIQNFVLMVDGRELPGRVLPKDEARRIYEDIVRTKRDPALLEYMGRGLYRTSVFPIPPGADRKVTMRYTQLCKRDGDIVEFSYPLSTQKFTAKPVQRLNVRVSIESKDAIKSVYCPSDDARIDRSGDHDVKLSLERREITPTNDFRLVYTLSEGRLSASILSYRPSAGEDGYFLLLASPEVKAPATKALPKTVLFVIDRSGSMAGKKIEQARNALKSVLNNLRDEDLFNILVYDDRVESFKPELQRYGPSVRDEAVRFVNNLREGGSTNIESALKTALAMIHDTSRPSYVLFLTDGLPTAGETRELSIADNCRQANLRRTRLFCFGVGYDVNARLLDRLSGGNSGTSEYVKPDEDIESHIGRFYSKMTSPVLSEIRVELAGVDINRAYPREVPDLFDGGQIVWAGRYRESGKTTIRVSGKVGGETRSLEFPAELAGTDRGSGHDFVERLWVVRRLGDLIDQIDLHGQNKELVDELLALSTKYGILTPYTSFLADERVLLHAHRANADRAGVALRELEQVDGRLGVAQRDYKQAYMRAQRGSDASAAGPVIAGTAGGGLGNFASNTEGYAPASPLSPRSESRFASPMPGTVAASRGSGGMLGGGPGQRGSQPLKSNQAQQQPQTAAAPAIQPNTDSISSPPRKPRQIGLKTFYWKSQRWVDASVTPEEDTKATVVIQLSDAYFQLARTQKAEYNQYFSQSEPVTVKLDGKVYHIDPPAAEPAR
jgi:Ca-activated chloride channel homolog